MLALSMLVITAPMGTPDLGREICTALARAGARRSTNRPGLP